MSLSTQLKTYSQVPPTPGATPTEKKKDSIIVTRDSIPYNFDSSQNGSLFLNTPKEIEVIFDSELQKYVIREKIGG